MEVIHLVQTNEWCWVEFFQLCSNTWVSVTLSPRLSLSSIVLGRSCKLHPGSSQNMFNKFMLVGHHWHIYQSISLCIYILSDEKVFNLVIPLWTYFGLWIVLWLLQMERNSYIFDYNPGTLTLLPAKSEFENQILFYIHIYIYINIIIYGGNILIQYLLQY